MSDVGPLPAETQRGNALPGSWARAVQVALVVVLVAGVVLRFWTRSALWLDEALTVDIARLPVHAIPSYLRRDGAPPLYYVLLHYWMDAFGQSDLAVRSLAGVISLVTLPVAWLAGRRVGGRARGPAVGWVVVVLLASAPFAVYYASEARMYSLVMLLTACGALVVPRVLEHPRPGNVIALAAIGSALLYTQYWALYLLGSFGIWLLWQAWRGPADRRDPARWMLGAMVISGLSFFPWVPTFLYQAHHTGTPWARPANFAAVISAISGFTANQATLSRSGSNQGMVLAIGYFFLAALGIFGVARGRWGVDLDLRTREPGRTVGFVIVVTLVAAAAGGIISGSAFAPRYASVVFIPLLLLVALGTASVGDAAVRVGVVAVVAVAGLAVGVENIWTQRTQAPQVAHVLAAHARRGDIVVFCPDQLGPSVYRYFQSTQSDTSGRHGRLDMVTYPRGTGPAFVDWVTYEKVVKASDPAAFAAHVEQAAGSAHDIWLVSAPGYQGFGNDCQALAGDLGAAVGFGERTWVTTDPAAYYEPMGLIQLVAPRSPRQVPRGAGA
ncbi:MAG: glycosyltransferase family 39 protein [Acidimicrobiales bacterium]